MLDDGRAGLRQSEGQTTIFSLKNVCKLQYQYNYTQLKIFYIILLLYLCSTLLYSTRGAVHCIPLIKKNQQRYFWYMNFVFLSLGCYCYYFSIIINKHYFVRCTTLYAKFIRASRCSLSSQGRIASIARSA